MDGAQAVADILEHHGVKGMKWGVRNTAGSASDTSGVWKPKTRKDKRFERTVQTPLFKSTVHNSTVATMNNVTIPKINKRYQKEIANKTFKDKNHPRTKQYMDEVMNEYIKEANRQMSQVRGPSGQKLTATRRPSPSFARRFFLGDYYSFDVHVEDVKHADEALYSVAVILDPDDGTVKDFKMVNAAITQSGLDATDHILEHHGIKGMKWGVRRDRPSAVSVSQKPGSRLPGRRLKTKGGYGRSASEEAITSRTTGQVIRKSGVHALSNKELQDYTKRLNLEQQAKRLQYESSSPPVKFVKKLLGQTGKTAAQDAANQASSVAVKKALKRAAIVAA